MRVDLKTPSVGTEGKIEPLPDRKSAWHTPVIIRIDIKRTSFKSSGMVDLTGRSITD